MVISHTIILLEAFFNWRYFIHTEMLTLTYPSLSLLDSSEREVSPRIRTGESRTTGTVHPKHATRVSLPGQQFHAHMSPPPPSMT